MQVRRSQYLFFSVQDSPRLDVAAFLRGKVEIATGCQIFALSLLTASRSSLTQDEFRWVAQVPAARWISIQEILDGSGLDGGWLEGLVHQGLLLSDRDDERAARLRKREELLTTLQWHPYAALYHFMTRWQESAAEVQPIDSAALEVSARDNAAGFVARHGPPADPFYRASTRDGDVALPVADKRGRFYDVLRRRATVRAFDPHRLLSLEDLSTLLRYVFGCHGTCRLSPELLMVHKTSPSGGSLHPIEAYPLILTVKDIDPGLYHYKTDTHSLEPIRRLDLPAAQKLATEICRGQLYAGSAHALVIMTARWYRNFWKYRRRSKTYGVVLMDAGHLSQTFYLVAAELGLGAFFTAAMGLPETEEALGLEAIEEAPIGVCGCGVPAREGPTLGLEFETFRPHQAD